MSPPLSLPCNNHRGHWKQGRRLERSSQVGGCGGAFGSQAGIVKRRDTLLFITVVVVVAVISAFVQCSTSQKKKYIDLRFNLVRLLLGRVFLFYKPETYMMYNRLLVR